VIEEKPSIVIWQTVVNDAIRDVGEEKLAKILRKGIRKVQAAGIDMIVMDLQWLPREDRYPHYDDYRAVLAKTAQEHGSRCSRAMQ
jgi:acyl-CoA thioesterase-1